MVIVCKEAKGADQTHTKQTSMELIRIVHTCNTDQQWSIWWFLRDRSTIDVRYLTWKLRSPISSLEAFFPLVQSAKRRFLVIPVENTKLCLALIQKYNSRPASA